MKKKLFPLFFLAMPISAMAYIGEDLMKVNTVGGDSWSYQVELINRLLFGEETFTVSTSDESTSVTFAYADVRNISFYFDGTGISLPMVQACALKAEVLGDELHVSGLDDRHDAKVEVYDARGRKVRSAVLCGAGTINVSGLIPGAYVLKAAAQTLKFTK